MCSHGIIAAVIDFAFRTSTMWILREINIFEYTHVNSWHVGGGSSCYFMSMYYVHVLQNQMFKTVCFCVVGLLLFY